MALTRGGGIFVNWGLRHTQSIQQIIAKPLSATNNRGPNGQAQKAIPARLPSRTDITATVVILVMR